MGVCVGLQTEVVGQGFGEDHVAVVGGVVCYSGVGVGLVWCFQVQRWVQGVGEVGGGRGVRSLRTFVRGWVL